MLLHKVDQLKLCRMRNDDGKYLILQIRCSALSQQASLFWAKGSLWGYSNRIKVSGILLIRAVVPQRRCLPVHSKLLVTTTCQSSLDQLLADGILEIFGE